MDRGEVTDQFKLQFKKQNKALKALALYGTQVHVFVDLSFHTEVLIYAPTLHTETNYK